MVNILIFTWSTLPNFLWSSFGLNRMSDPEMETHGHYSHLKYQPCWWLFTNSQCLSLTINIKHIPGWWFEPPLKNISQMGLLFPIYGKIKAMFQTTNQKLPCRCCRDEIHRAPWDQYHRGKFQVAQRRNIWRFCLTPPFYPFSCFHVQLNRWNPHHCRFGVAST